MKKCANKQSVTHVTLLSAALRAIGEFIWSLTSQPYNIFLSCGSLFCRNTNAGTVGKKDVHTSGTYCAQVEPYHSFNNLWVVMLQQHRCQWEFTSNLMFNGLGDQARFKGSMLASEEEPPNVYCNLYGLTNNLSEIWILNWPTNLISPLIICLGKECSTLFRLVNAYLFNKPISAMVNQQPPVHHSLDATYDSDVDEPQLS
jgi:hypothetical protein